MQDKVKLQQEFISYISYEIEPLAVDEWEESGDPTEALDINWEGYFALESSGNLKVFTARLDEELVGYIVVVTVAPLTNRTKVIGYFDSVFVVKSERKSSIARRLIKFTEGCLKKDGINTVIASSSEQNPIGNFLTRLGYEAFETKHKKVL